MPQFEAIGNLYTFTKEQLEGVLELEGARSNIAEVGGIDAEASVQLSRESEVTSEIKWSPSCLTCGIGVDTPAFSSVAEQRSHFKTDWHRHNVKKKLAGQATITQDAFDVLAHDGADMSSISGSGSDSEEDCTAANAGPQQTRGPRVVLHLPDGRAIAVWRAILAASSPSSEGQAPQNPASGLLSLRDSGAQWLVVLSRGGHFAAAVFRICPPATCRAAFTPEVIAHKTFHRYVVRAKAGGRQAGKDATGKVAKSAGSQIRRHNEAALEAEIRATLAAWRPHRDAAAAWFVAAPGANGAALSNGRDAVLPASDARLRSVPFTTRRPTFSETKRVVAQLLTVYAVALPPAPSPAPAVTMQLQQPQEQPNPAASSQQAAEQSSTAELEAGTESAASQDAILCAADMLDTPLHRASQANDADAVAALLESGADPTQRDARGRTPYVAAGGKEARDAFRRFMAACQAAVKDCGDGMPPATHDWDWAAAGIPSALTPETEAQQAARQAERRARLRERERERRRGAAQRKAVAAQAQQAAAEAEVAQAAAAATAAVKQPGGRRQKVGPRAAQAAEEARLQREKLAAAAEARMAGLRLATQQQQLYS